MTLYEFILDTIHTLIRNGITLSSAVAILVLALKNRKLKRYINNHIPKRFRDPQDDEIKEILLNVRAVSRHLGVEAWSVEKPKTSESTGKSSWPCSGRGSHARFAALFTHRKGTGKSIFKRRIKMIDKKWLVALFVTLAGVIKTKTGYVIPDDIINMFVDWLWLGGIVGLAGWDMIKKYRVKEPKITQPFEKPLDPKELPFDSSKSS